MRGVSINAAVVRRWPVAIAFAAALVARLAQPWRSSGLRSNFGYDGGVYYAAADALIHGRLPYGDYTLLHPPALVLALTPFAGLGSATADHVGYGAAIVAVAVLGATNAALVAGLAQRLDWGRRAAAVAGLGYALWWGAIGAEFSIRLEPLGNLFTLLGLHALVSAEQRHSRRFVLLAGAGFGAAAVTKIWWSVPAAVVLVWLLAMRSRRREAVPYLAGVFGAGAVIAGPFFVAAPSAMWHMVVLDQLQRSSMPALLYRLARLTGIAPLAPGFVHPYKAEFAAAGAALLVAGCVFAWRARYGPLVVGLALVQVALLVRAPSYFTFYNDFIAVPLALLAGAAVRVRTPEPTSRSLPGWRVAVRASGVAVAALAAAALLIADLTAPLPVPTLHLAALRPAVRGVRCVMADEPSVLIELDRLTPNLEHGCPDWVDVTGRTYGPDAMRVHGRTVPRPRNTRWQRDLTRYLFSGQRIVIGRAAATGIGPELYRRLRAAGLLAQASGIQVYRGS